MKKLIVFILVLTSIISQSVFGQVIRIEVSETYHTHVIDTVGINIVDIINSTKFVDDFSNDANVSYEFDLTRNQFKYFYRGELETEGNIIFNNVGSLYMVSFLIDGYDIGMLINLDVNNEQVSWFSLFGVDKDIYKFTRFQIIKGM
jgi:hypothetical protein